MRFARGVFGDDGKDDFAGGKVFQTIFARDKFCLRRKDGGDANEVLRGDAGVAQGELKGSEALFVLAYSLGEKQPLWDHAFSQFKFLHWQSFRL